MIIVAGGGPAGVAAAISASRLKTDVLLIERYGFLGGMGTAGLVHPWMTYHAGKKQIIGGVFQEIITKLKKYKAFKTSSHFGNVHHCFDPEILKIVLQQMTESAKVKVLFHCFATDVLVKENKVLGVFLQNKSGRQMLKADLVIDATGDGDIAYFAGCEYRKGRPEDGLMQPMSLHFRMDGVNTKKMPSREKINKIYLEAKKKGKIHIPRENLLWFDTTRPDEIHFNTTRVVNVDGTRVEDLTKAEIESRKQMLEIVEFLQKEVRGFEKAYLLVSAPQIGVRDTRRIKGQYILTSKDVLEARKFSDAVCCGSYDVDIHNPKGEGTTIEKLKPGEFYQIPYRCLVPERVDNLLVAGRCISTTHRAQSSVRIQAICYAMGQAAGAAAGLCVKEKIQPRNLDVKKLQAELLKQKAILD